MLRVCFIILSTLNGRVSESEAWLSCRSNSTLICDTRTYCTEFSLYGQGATQYLLQRVANNKVTDNFEHAQLHSFPLLLW